MPVGLAMGFVRGAVGAGLAVGVVDVPEWGD